MCNEVVFPGELPVGLGMLLSRGPHSLSAAQRPGVEPPCTCSPYSPMQAPSEGSSVQLKRSAIPLNCCGAHHAPVVRPPFTFRCILRPGFEFSLRARAGPRAAAVEDEGVGPFLACWSCSARWHTPSRSLPRSLWPPLSVHVQITMPGPPDVIMLRTQAVRMKSLQGAE
jgi:hypothetical protein